MESGRVVGAREQVRGRGCFGEWVGTLRGEVDIFEEVGGVLGLRGG
jgi:hypothetical protein